MTPYSLNMKDSAHYIGVSYDTIQEAVVNGAIPAFRRPGKGRLIFIKVKDLENFVTAEPVENLKNCMKEAV